MLRLFLKMLADDAHPTRVVRAAEPVPRPLPRPPVVRGGHVTPRVSPGTGSGSRTG